MHNAKMMQEKLPAKHPQAGLTLLSLLIGLLLTSLSIMAMLSLYRNAVQNATESLQTAAQNGQQALGVITAQMELQNAGFGIIEQTLREKSFVVVVPDPSNTADYLELTAEAGNNLQYRLDSHSGNLKLTYPADPEETDTSAFTEQPTSEGTGFALVWAKVSNYDDARSGTPAYQCVGLMALHFGLTLLTSDNCPLTSDGITAALLKEIKWSTTPLIDDQSNPNISPSARTSFTIKQESSCQPFNQDIGVNADTLPPLVPEVTLHIKSSFWADPDDPESTGSGQNLLKQDFTSCLANYRSI